MQILAANSNTSIFFLFYFPQQYFANATKIKDSQPFFVREQVESRYLAITQLASYPISYVSGGIYYTGRYIIYIIWHIYAYIYIYIYIYIYMYITK